MSLQTIFGHKKDSFKLSLPYYKKVLKIGILLPCNIVWTRLLNYLIIDSKMLSKYVGFPFLSLLKIIYTHYNKIYTKFLGRKFISLYIYKTSTV